MMESLGDEDPEDLEDPTASDGAGDHDGPIKVRCTGRIEREGFYRERWLFRS